MTKYGNLSNVYSVLSNVQTPLAFHLDWKQVAIMIEYILRPNQDYHHTTGKKNQLKSAANILEKLWE